NMTPFKDLQLTLDRTHKREAPQQMQPTETLMKKQQGIQLLEHSRQELLHALHSVIDEKDLFENGLKHPVFNDLNLYQWVQFLDLHEQRHLTQLKEAKHAILQR
ncbi:DinB family protein, partial [Bacillus cereus]|nr:DinB family protein [Bacillus cereus]